MKIWLMMFGILGVGGVALALYIGVQSSNSHPTPEEALHAERHGREVIRVLDTVFHDNGNAAYVVYITEDNQLEESLAVASFDGNRFGWRYRSRINLGDTDLIPYGNFTAAGGFVAGYAPDEASAVRFDDYHAMLTPVDGQNVWILHDPSSDDLETASIRFYNSNGAPIDID
ncbi:hypothetical protein CR205_02655 [Alteribacter lacisalsi]|uniref:Uncharacterized protein n=1 Tax=Alteribacter lacisalsi TaxID=2045244 RepID=A0A2W0H6N3_9BACI|nr:hypothetical protein [Alteribacter lacisalsi]PYZ97514.1 hypothetical protein CR205_02655 [Alteribacter lacisalsi]